MLLDHTKINQRGHGKNCFSHGDTWGLYEREQEHKIIIIPMYNPGEDVIILPFLDIKQMAVPTTVIARPLFLQARLHRKGKLRRLPRAAMKALHDAVANQDDRALYFSCITEIAPIAARRYPT